MLLRRAVFLSCLGLSAGGASVALASTPDAEFRSADSRQATILEEPCPANEFPLRAGLAFSPSR